MAGVKYNGWTNSWKLESVKASILFLIILVVDTVIFRYAFAGGSDIMFSLAFGATNILGIILVLHWARRGSIRKGFWLRFYPLEETTLLDAVVGYLEKKRLKFRDLGEKNINTDNFSDVIRCIDPFFEVRLRPVSFMGTGVVVHLGPLDDENSDRMHELMDDFEGFMEKDLIEGIPRATAEEE